MDHHGRIVIQKHIPIRDKMRIHAQSLHGNDDNFNLTCEAIHGLVPIWRDYLFRASLIAIPFVFVVIPAMIAIWFVIASCLYLLYYRENRRQDILLHTYNDKQKKMI